MPCHPSCPPSRRPLSAIVGLAVCLFAVLAALACRGAPAECRPAPLTDDASRKLEARSLPLDFAPTLPCTFSSNARVTAVYLDTLPGSQPGDPSGPRISLEVTRAGARLYLLSQTRIEVRSSAIPLSSHPLRATLEADPPIEAAGFAGPAGTGDEIAYLRWRRDGITTELLATLSPTFTEDDVVRVARALMATP